MDNLEATFSDMTRCLDRAAFNSATFTALTNEESEHAHRLIAAFQRKVTLITALSAANLRVRSDWTLGREGLARMHGFSSPEEFVQSLGGGGAGTKTEARKLIEAGTLATETETARERQKEADARALEFPDIPPVEVEQPWFAPLGDAVAEGVFSVEAATAIRRGLGEPAIGVTADMLRAALILLIPECATVNADQASRAARHMRDRIDNDGIASRTDAMRARQYLKVYDRPDGMLHGDFLLDPENGQFMKSFLLQVVGPRLGGPRFTEEGAKARAQSIIDDPRPTDQIAAEALIEALHVAAKADPGEVFGPVAPSVKAVFTVSTDPAPGTTSGTGTGSGTETHYNSATTADRRDGRESVLILPRAVAGSGDRDSVRWGIGNGLLEGTIEPVPAATLARLICIGGFTPILFNTTGQPLDVGRAQRLFTSKQRSALAIRDGGCMMPGCMKPPSWAETHHLHGWAGDNGLTDIKDGILFCKPCHLRIHNDGWLVTRTRALNGCGDEYWLIPPPKADPAQTPIRLYSRSSLNLRSPFHDDG